MGIDWWTILRAVASNAASVGSFSGALQLRVEGFSSCFLCLFVYLALSTTLCI